MASRLYSKIRRNYEDGGLGKVFTAGVKKVSHTLYNKNDAFWFRSDLGGEIGDIPLGENISVHIDDPDETIQYIKDYGYYYPEEIRVGLAASHLYSNIKYNGKIVGYNKTGLSRVYIEDFGKVYDFLESVAFTYDTFVDPLHRNRGYGACLLNAVCKHLQRTGFRSIWAHIPPWNKASEAMHGKLGFQRHKKIAHYSIAGISWTTSDPLRLIETVESSIT